MDTVKDVLRRLSEAVGLAGFEDEARSRVHETIEGLADKVWVDPLGNLLAVRTGKEERPRILLDAHLDEIGFLVQYVHDEGFLRVTPLGGWDPRILPGQRVVLMTRDGKKFRRIFGVFAAVPPHLTTPAQREKVIPFEDLIVDIGVGSREEAQALGVKVGSPLTVWQPFVELSDDVVTGKALDDRAGCTVLIEVLRRLADMSRLPATVAFNFAVGEEVGGRGARTGAYTLNPDVALAIECTSAGDFPGIAKHQSPTRLGGGPAITIADQSMVAHPHVIATLEEVATEKKLHWQYKQPLGGGTDGGPISMTRRGVPTGVVSVPCRYIHSAIGVLRLSDLEATVDLVHGFIKAWSPKRWKHE
jgi:putative aminopeptidase FrvX